ncbi:MAG: penicillin-binding protein, partial [Alphaproteobacteria bacterium]|nr:penicillin-binding protein [Alphaproteobacteria bacterium]
MRLEDAVEAEGRRRLRPWQRDYWRSRGRLWWTLRALAAAALAFIALIGWLAVTAPLSKSLEPIAAPQVTLLASDGTPIARQGAMVAEPVEIATLPPHVPQAFMAIEDRRFRSHWGIDPRGIARAIWTGRGGGSTITQQLAKFTFLTPEQTLTRKAREALIALWLEAWLTKDEILERYLSNAYFGDNQYGLRAASLHYFYRQPENLLPQQAAMLAG